jgi:hypothetical protein
MKKPSPEELDAYLNEIRELCAYVDNLPPERAFTLPAFVSHAKEYSPNVERLRKYAGSIVNTRIIQFLGLSFMKTSFFLNLYLDGLEKRNPFALFLGTRCQMEVFAVIFDTMAIIEKNAGDHEADYASRVQAIDEALLNATYGTRNKDFPKWLGQVAPSKIRPMRTEDTELLEARNILTRIDKVARKVGYEFFREDYDRLSEYLHPNVAQNVVLIWPSSIGGNIAKVSRVDSRIMETALNATSGPMALTARGTVQALQVRKPPFAWAGGRWVFPDRP